MLLKRKSILSGIERTMDLPITEDQLRMWEVGGTHAQHAFPHLTPSQREFIISGINDEEWDENFSEENNS